MARSPSGLWLDARIRATGSITGALGGYASAWVTPRLLLKADYLYIKVKPEDEEAAVTDWRIGANYYFFRSAGLGAQYKFYRYSYDRGIVSTRLGGEITYKGFQVYLSFLL